MSAQRCIEMAEGKAQYVGKLGHTLYIHTGKVSSGKWEASRYVPSNMNIRAVECGKI